MPVREFFTWQSSEFGFLWKIQMLVGVLLVLAGILIVLVPQILVALVATAVIMVGVTLLSSAWRLRRLEERARGVAVVETFEW